MCCITPGNNVSHHPWETMCWVGPVKLCVVSFGPLFWAYACICMHMHAYACVCMHMHGYVCICMHIHAYACISMHIHAYACICMHVHADACIGLYMHAYPCICMHVRLHGIHGNIHVHGMIDGMHVYPSNHTYTCTSTWNACISIQSYIYMEMIHMPACTSVCMYMHACTFICMPMHAYACISMDMHAYASICIHHFYWQLAGCPMYLFSYRVKYPNGVEISYN